jgi:hypothetical protein
VPPNAGTRGSMAAGGFNSHGGLPFQSPPRVNLARGVERHGFLARADLAAATLDALGSLDGGEAP